MNESALDDATNPIPKPKKDDVLSFRCLNRLLQLEDLEAEFALILTFFPKGLDADDFRRVGDGSGTHLLKLTTPRTSIGQHVLRISGGRSNASPAILPSVNAPDIPIAKFVFRPLEIVGRPPKSIADHLRNPDDISEAVLAVFAKAVGKECLEALRQSLDGDGPSIMSLPATGEFPIIFLPRPGGGDLQATPVSPAEAFMGFKHMSSAWFQKQERDAPPVPRGQWAKQAVSAKPQNISGAIGGPRMRFLAEMPSVLRGYEASILRYARGGSFPSWNDDRLQDAVLLYAARLERAYTNAAIREGTDRFADRLIASALDFMAEVRLDAMELLEREGRSGETLRPAPRPSALILRRRWNTAETRATAMRALTSPHFRDRERNALETVEA